MKGPKPRPEVPGNGPYHWGNGPKKQGVITRLVKKLLKGK